MSCEPLYDTINIPAREIRVGDRMGRMARKVTSARTVLCKFGVNKGTQRVSVEMTMPGDGDVLSTSYEHDQIVEVQRVKEGESDG